MNKIMQRGKKIFKRCIIYRQRVHSGNGWLRPSGRWWVRCPVSLTRALFSTLWREFPCWRKKPTSIMGNVESTSDGAASEDIDAISASGTRSRETRFHPPFGVNPSLIHLYGFCVCLLPYQVVRWPGSPDSTFGRACGKNFCPSGAWK